MKSSLPPYWASFKVDHERVEKGVSGREGSYQNLNSLALYTSDEDLLELFAHPLVTGSFCDLGCGTGRTSLLYGALFPERKSYGIEFELERLAVGEEFKKTNALANVELIHDDLLTATIPIADNYFLYFPTGPVLDRILSVLFEMTHPFRILCIESHGDLMDRLELENWLEMKDTIPLHSQRHNPFAKIYQKTNTQRDPKLLPFTLSYKNKILVIGDEEWLGETRGMEWSGEDLFELKSPPRTIRWAEVRKVIDVGSLSERAQFAIGLRRLGLLTIKLSSCEKAGHVRKIITKPTFQLELSSGEKVEWEKILTISQGSHICYESSRSPYS